MKIALVTDAWRPQTNGVVTTLICTLSALRRLGHDTLAITPEAFRTIPCPSYPEIRLALFAGRQVARTLGVFAPDAVHIATEGPLGQAGRAWCLRTQQPFTTSYHTQFPEYVRARYPIPERWTYAFLRRFHGKAARVMVSTDHMRRQLEAHGFHNLAMWTRGVDLSLFRAYPRDLLDAARPILLYAGRVAVEKNLEAFLGLDVPGTKYVVGGGPALEALRARYPQVVFTGYKYGEELARHIASADVWSRRNSARSSRLTPYCAAFAARWSRAICSPRSAVTGIRFSGAVVPSDSFGWVVAAFTAPLAKLPASRSASKRNRIMGRGRRMGRKLLARVGTAKHPFW